jgi:hypothetical protein
MKSLLRNILLLSILLPQFGYSLVGSMRAGKGWEAIVYIEFNYANDDYKTHCSGFLINASQVITVGHCAIHDESRKKAKAASVCLGIKKPFSNPGEGCFQSSKIRFAKNYQYNTPTDMVIINLAESVPLNFLGIKPIKLLSAIEAYNYYQKQTRLNQQEIRIFSFGSRNFSAPTLGKKGWAKVSHMQWDKIRGVWQANVKGVVYGQADDGAGLLIKTPTGWALSGLLLNSIPDFFVSVQPYFDPCLPPEPAPRQPNIKITSSFNFVSLNTIACTNNFFSKNLRSNKFCKIKPLTYDQLVNTKDDMDQGGKIAFEVYQRTQKLGQQLKWLNTATRRGHPKAMLILAEHYAKGKGLRVNTDKALALVETAAKSSYPEAQYQIGLIMKNQSSKRKVNLSGKSYQWFLKAAEQGHAAAQYEYALRLSTINPAQSYDWLMRSARQGFAAAQYQLGLQFYNGNGIRKDPYIGKQWIEYAAGQGHPAANQFIRRNPIQPTIEY